MASLFLVLAVAHGATQSAEVTFQGNGLTAAALSSQYTYMELRVADPSGNLLFTASSDGRPIAWSVPPSAPDGQYSWEVRLGTAASGQERAGEQAPADAPRSEVESGSFLLQGGAIVNPYEEETSLLDAVLDYGSYALNAVAEFILPSAHADQVFLDDLIVIGSTCVGQDCVNGEDFGFDTIRLKENNLRIRFNDTSNSGSFPTNDWEITANETTNGGKSYFGVLDVDHDRRLFTLEAGAPANSLYVHSSGKVGLGTSVPSVKLHVADGDSPTMRLDQDGTAGWATQSWDVGGNEQNFFIRDVTNNASLPLRIVPGATDNALVIGSGGKVGIGVPSPTHALHVAGDALITGNLELSSSRELKNNIESLDSAEAMATLASLRPVKFRYKASPDEQSVGFIAEEVPDLVATNSRKSVSPMDVVAVMTRVLQEQQKAIEELNRTVRDLQIELQQATVNAVNVQCQEQPSATKVQYGKAL